MKDLTTRLRRSHKGGGCGKIGKNNSHRLGDSMDSNDKDLLIYGLLGTSPIPIVGEIGMYLFIERVLEGSSFRRGLPRSVISFSAGVLTRLYGIYPLYKYLYEIIGDKVPDLF